MKEASDSHCDRSAGEYPQDAHFPGLVGRMLDDLVRIGEAQAKIFEINIGTALSTAFDHAIVRTIVATMYLFGGLCLLGAIIVLLRRRLLWWEALAIAGALMIMAGCLTQWVAGRLAARRASRAQLE